MPCRCTMSRRDASLRIGQVSNILAGEEVAAYAHTTRATRGLSNASATVPIEGETPTSARRSLNAIEVYWSASIHHGAWYLHWPSIGQRRPAVSSGDRSTGLDTQ